MHNPTHRRVFIACPEGQEIEVVDLASLHVGDVFRMAPPDGVDDPKLNRRWFRVTDEAVRWVPSEVAPLRWSLSWSYGGSIASYSARYQTLRIFHPAAPHYEQVVYGDGGIRAASYAVAAYLIKHGIPCSLRSKTP
jgi:hypothetical protein